MWDFAAVLLAVFAALFVAVLLFMRGARRLNAWFDAIQPIADEGERRMLLPSEVPRQRRSGGVLVRPRQEAPVAD